MHNKLNKNQFCYMIAILALITFGNIGCRKVDPGDFEVADPSGNITMTVMADESEITATIADDGQFDFKSINREICETMLARNYEKAIELLDKAINECESKNLSMDIWGTFFIDSAYCHVMLGEDEKAIPCMEKVCLWMPDSDYMLGGYGCLFHRLERYDEAIEQYQKAIELRKKANPYFFSAEEQGYCWSLFMAYNCKGDLRNAYDVYKTIKSRLEEYQFHVEPAIKELINSFKGINDDNWESMPRFRVEKKLPDHPYETDAASVFEGISKRIDYDIKVYFDLIDDVPK